MNLTSANQDKYVFILSAFSGDRKFEVQNKVLLKSRFDRYELYTSYMGWAALMRY